MQIHFLELKINLFSTIVWLKPLQNIFLIHKNNKVHNVHITVVFKQK